MKTHSTTLKSKIQKIPTIWKSLAMLILALFLPFIAELLQWLIIGDEQVCCMPDNIDFLQARAAIARHLRPLSILIIAGAMVAGVVLAAYAVRYFYQHYQGVKRTKIIVTIILTLLATYIAFTIATMLTFFIVRNDLYFYERPWPGGSLYGGAWYNPVHWLRAAFANPFA